LNAIASAIDMAVHEHHAVCGKMHSAMFTPCCLRQNAFGAVYLLLIAANRTAEDEFVAVFGRLR
jgi:hypothetical protein